MDTEPSLLGSGSETSKWKRRAIAQGQKACNLCRLRKVRCSYESPCQTCLARQHPELCQYDPPLRRVPLDPAASAQESPPQPRAGPGLVSRDDWDELMDKIDRLAFRASPSPRISHRHQGITLGVAGAQVLEL